MAQTPSLRSDLLDARLRAHHASLSHSRNSSTPTHYQGRDDNIFDTQDYDNDHERRGVRYFTSGRDYMSSPAGPSSSRRISGSYTPAGSSAAHTFSSPHGQVPSAWRASSNTRPGSNRRTSGTLSSSLAQSSTPRAMGARELEDHVDKLSKQNFDLKLEVYHRRAKIDELEKKLVEAQQLEEDNVELLEVNEELVAELEKRDRAVDEAVVLICDLEDRNAMLEEQLREARLTNELSKMSLREVPASQTPLSIPQRTSSEVKTKTRPEFVTPEKDGKRRAPRVPSFIHQPKASELTLRSLYLHDGKAVRPIPSVATMRSFYSPNARDELDLDEPQSPVFSVLSRSDLGSLYEQDLTVEHSSPSRRGGKSVRSSEAVSEQPLSEDDLSSEGRYARVTRWVSDRAISPPVEYRSPRGQERSGEDPAYQSLTSVLARDDEVSVSSPGQKRKRPSLPHVDPEALETPLASRSTYGPNVFPPTPDTFATTTPAVQRSKESFRERASSSQPSLHSRPSKTSTIRSPAKTKLAHHSTTSTPSRRERLVHHSPVTTSRRELTLPWELEAYTDGTSADIPPKQDSAIAISAPESLHAVHSRPVSEKLDEHDLFVATALTEEEGLDKVSLTRVKVRTGDRRLLARRGHSFDNDSSSAPASSIRPVMSPRTMTAPAAAVGHQQYPSDEDDDYEQVEQPYETEGEETVQLSHITPPKLSSSSVQPEHISTQPDQPVSTKTTPQKDTFSFTGFERTLPASPSPVTTTFAAAKTAQPSQTLERASSIRQRMARFVRRSSTSKGSKASSNLSLVAGPATSGVSLVLSDIDKKPESKAKRFKFGRTNTNKSEVSLAVLPAESGRPPLSATQSFDGRSSLDVLAMARPTTTRSMSSGSMLSPPLVEGQVSRMGSEGQRPERKNVSPSVEVRVGWPGAVNGGDTKRSDSSGSMF